MARSVLGSLRCTFTEIETGTDAVLEADYGKIRTNMVLLNYFVSTIVLLSKP